MRLARLAIQQLPGIEPGFDLDVPSPGVNVITGPNAIGKSSVLRALRLLLAEPDADDPAALAIEADLDGDRRYTVRRTGSAQVWTVDGRGAPRPGLPDGDALRYYWLTMESLVEAGADDERLVAELHRALAGGYSFAELRSGFERQPRVGNNEAKALRVAIQQRRERENAYRELAREEARLPDFDADIERADAAARRADRLDDALALAELVAQRRAIEAALAALPPDMERLRGDELQRLDRLDETGAGLDERRIALDRAQKQAQARLDRTGLADDRPELSLLEAQQARLHSTARAQDRLDEIRTKVDAAHAAEAQAREALGAHDTLAAVAPEAVDRAEGLARRLREREGVRDELQARIDNAPEPPGAAAIDRLRDAAEALGGWLAASRRSTRTPLAAAVVAGLACLAGALAAALVQAWFAVAATFVALAAVIRLASLPRRDAARHARAVFQASGFDPPHAWLVDAVRARRDALQQEHDRLCLQRERALAAVEDRRRLADTERALADLAREKHALAGAIGFDPSLAAQAFDHVVRILEGFRAATTERRAQEATRDRLARDIDAELTDVGRCLARWQPDLKPAHAELEAALAALRRRVDEADAAQQEIDRLRIERTHLETDARTNAEDRARLFEEAAVESGERAALAERVARLDDWQQKTRERRDNELYQAERRRTLENEPALVANADAGEREPLASEHDECRQRSAGRDALVEQRSDLRSRVKHAGDDRRLEQAVAAVDKTTEALERQMEGQLFAEAGQFLLDAVENEHSAEHEPAVLADARARFTRFTHRAWDIELHEQSLQARDNRQDTLRELAELSSGTRMQLLLALRLAWTTHLEQGRESLPLFLDEALTTSDEKRFAAVAESLVDLAANEGRQVFYLSARRQDFAYWEAATGQRPAHIDLAEVRFGQSDAEPADYALAELPQIPPPDDRSPEAYAAALGLPAVDPRLSAAAIHPFHLLRDDLELLHRLMQTWHITSLGQLERLLASDAAASAIPEVVYRKTLRGRCQTARAWVEAWRIGRGRPVDRATLEASGAVSAKFVDRTSTLAEHCNGDAQQLLAALENGEVKRFRQSNIDSLRDWLVTSGHLDDAPTLGRDARERKTLQAAGPDADPEDARQLVHWLEGGAAIARPAYGESC